MTQYNTLNIKLSNSQLKIKIKSRIKNGINAILNLSSSLIRSSNDETNFPHKLLLIDTQVSKICEAFANGSSANKKFLKTQLSKIVQLGGFVFGPPVTTIKETTSLVNLITNSFKKELKSTGTKTFNNNILKDAELHIIGKKIKKEFHQLWVQE